jgi:hypothetical protein
LILGQFAMKVDTRPFLGINMVEGHRDAGEQSARQRLNFTFDVNMQDHRDAATRRRGPVPTIDPGKVKGSTSPKNR